MDEKDKEMEYLEERIKELELMVQKLAKDKRKKIFGRHRPFRFPFSEHDELQRPAPVCSMCGTSHNVDLMDGLDVYLCSNCSNNWN